MSCTTEKNYGVLGVLAKKLGIHDDRVLQKASEILRLSETKTSQQQLMGSATGQNVICLDIAANMKGASIDRAVAIKLSGMTKKTYQLQLYTIERLLDLQPPLSVRDICVRLGCTELCPLAERLLQRHQENSEWTKKEHPMYTAGAIFTVAKKQKFSIDKQKLAELGRSRTRQLDIVHSLMSKTLDQMSGAKKTNLKGPHSRGQTLVDLLANCNQTNVPEKEPLQHEEEDYEVWKARMLKEAEDEQDFCNLTG